MQAPSLKLVDPERTLLKLDLGCGDEPKEGFDGVDIRGEKAKFNVNLFKFPFPWKDSSVEEINCAHFVEHLPAREVEERDLEGDPEWNREFHAKFLGKDFMFAFFDECYRILIPGGKMRVVVPHVKCNGAFQDPTHRRFFVQETFNYLSKSARTQMSVGHYNAECDFHNVTVPVGSAELATYCDEVQARMFAQNWNVIFELHATLTSLKK